MIRVGFLLSIIFPEEYPGGMNYMINLFYALSKVKDKKTELILFIGRKMSRVYEDKFSHYGKIVRTSILDRKSPHWFAHKIFYKFFNSNFFINRLMKKYNINIVSHSNIIGRKFSFKILNWIPDFQFIHLPHLWNEGELKRQERFFRDKLDSTDMLLLSSYDALDDCKKFALKHSQKARVVQFVSQPNSDIYKKLADNYKEVIEKKYCFKGKFFYLPNQFWIHKNHFTVFKAVNLLKQRGKEILLICTGLMENADSPERGFDKHITILKNYISENKLQDNIKTLGLIEYSDVQYMVRNSISVINPSFFEGWSSTVEECKSIGKSIILSNLKVHIEQNPPSGIFFDPNNPEELADILEKRWNESDGGPDFELEAEAKKNIEARTIKFGEEYQKVILELVGNV